MGRFDGKAALISGAGGFLGGAIAERLASEGAKVVICDKNPQGLKKTEDRIRASGGKAVSLVCDVTDSADVDRVVSEAVRAYGDLDISIHVAGGSARIAGPGAKYVPLTEQTDEVIDAVLKVNLYGAMYVARAAAGAMIRAGHGGRILSFSSICGVQGLQNCTEYAAAKGGVIAFTKSFAKEMGKHGITVNSVAPGVVARPGEGADTYGEITNFLGRKCTAEDVASLTAFLASDEAGFITGQTYVIDGGRSLAMRGSEQ